MITARYANRRLTAAQHQMSKIVDQLPLAVNAIHRHIAEGGDRDQPEDAGIRSVGGHTDPTGDAAIASIGNYERHLEDLEQQLGTLTLTLGLLVDQCSRWVVSARNSEEHPRCSGGGGVDEWADPTCTNHQDYRIAPDGSYRYNRDGLCVACIKRRYRWRKNLEAAEIA